MGEVVWPNAPEAKRQGLYGHWPDVRAYWYPIGIGSDFILCKIDEMPLVLEGTFFETHTVDVRRKSGRLWCAIMAKN